MKIAYLIPEYPGQTHIFFLREMKALKKMGYHVDVVSTRRPPSSIVCHQWSEQAIAETSYLMPSNVSTLLGAICMIIMCGPKRWCKCLKVIVGVNDVALIQRFRMMMLFLVAGRLARFVKKYQWDHLHVHSCADSAILALFVHHLIDLPYSMTLHGPLSMYGIAQREKWSHAKFVITVTQLLKNEVIESISDIDSSKIHVAPMGVDLDVFQRKHDYPMQPIDGYWRLVSCGRLHYGKGHQDVIRAVDQLIKIGCPVHLAILGEGAERIRLEELIVELDLHSSVTLLGAVKEEQVCDELEKAHLFVLGSHDEAIGVATMEAMAMGLPVVVTDVGGVHELIRQGLDGVMVEPQKPGVMVQTIRQILSDMVKAKSIGENGQKRILEKFSSDVSAKVIATQIFV